MAGKKKKSKIKKIKRFIRRRRKVIYSAILLALVILLCAVLVKTLILKNEEVVPETTTSAPYEEPSSTMQESTVATTETTTQEETTIPETTTEKPTAYIPEEIPGNTEYPADTSAWQLICLNRSRYIGSDAEKSIKLSYVAGSGERMDSRAAEAYEEMYAAAAQDGFYLTPCSGYRSYSTQKRLYYEFVNDYMAQGYSQSEAEDLASRRRNPPGSSEHNVGICMDIICASSSAGFENTSEYAWLCENAADYGFILRYPADKTDVTGVKYEPWHWRYVGVENAHAIKASGLCLEEYLGLA